MKKSPALPNSLALQYQRLCRSLASIGYISQGSVLDRSTLRTPRSGYQWTRKVAQRTITVALTQEQFFSLGRAIENRREVRRILVKMEKLSRRIIFQSLPHTHRRKSLPKKVLGII